MASTRQTIRTQPTQPLTLRQPWALLYLVATWLAALFSPLTMATAIAAPGDLRSVGGTTRGLMTPMPRYSVGAQIGNYGGTGLSLQRVGLPGGGAGVVTVGIDHGTLGISGDYLLFATDHFRLLPLGVNSTYQQLRGQLALFVGGGLGLQDGLYVRAPIGIQYTMLRDPFCFFGGAALAIGPFFGDQDVEPQAWLSVGMRVLL